MTQLTRGTWTVQKLIGVDQAAHRAFFTANRDEAIEEHVYSIDYRAPGEPQRLTEAGFSNTAVMNKAGSAIIVTRSSPTQPPQVYAASADGRRAEEHTSELQALMRISYDIFCLKRKKVKHIQQAQ